MSFVEDDEYAWNKYRHRHIWFNKLYIAESLGYVCGPCGVAPSERGKYVVRPIYNLSGMGLGASVKTIEAGDYSQVPPGYFWCEYFTGAHYSATYKFVRDPSARWELQSCWVGSKHETELYKFTKWTRSDYAPTVPYMFNALYDVEYINVEFIGDNVIEVHLRKSPDPDYDELIPAWKYNGVNELHHNHYLVNGYKFVSAYDNADGFLTNPRIGFWVK